MSFLVDVMGATSIFAASPAIAQALHLSAAGLQWIVVAATVPAGAILLVGGWLADLLGPRRMFLTGLALLLATSLASGLAPGAAVLIAARAGQGTAGALLMPAALSLILQTFNGQAEQRTALAAWSAIGGIGATAGLLLGGAVTAGLGWRWVFLINVPVTAAMLAASPLVLAEPTGRDSSRRADVAGTASFSIGIALVIYAISQVPPSAGLAGGPSARAWPQSLWSQRSSASRPARRHRSCPPGLPAPRRSWQGTPPWSWQACSSTARCSSSPCSLSGSGDTAPCISAPLQPS
jgi:MFS family permease